MSDVAIHVLDHVDKMLFVQFTITCLFAHVYQVIQVTPSPVVNLDLHKQKQQYLIRVIHHLVVLTPGAIMESAHVYQNISGILTPVADLSVLSIMIVQLIELVLETNARTRV